MGEGCSLREFRHAMDAIVDCAAAENGGTRRMLEDEVNKVEVLYKRVVTSMRNNNITDILPQCDGFISEWEMSGRVSAAMQQLIALLNRPHIRCAIVAAHDIANGRYSPELPPVPFEVDDDDAAVKIVRIVKRGDPVGATIKKGSKGRILIARVMKNGAAERSGCIQEGDRLLEINGTSVAGMEPERIAAFLDEVESSSITLKLVPGEPLAINASASNIHLRALVDYNGHKDRAHPVPESAISFSKGDILELHVVGDEYWWQASRIGHGALAGTKVDTARNGHVVSSPPSSLAVGIVPSETLLMKRRAGGTLRRDGDAVASGGTLRSKSSKASVELEDSSPPYESVCRLAPSARTLPRPVLLVGAPAVGRNELKRRLLQAYPGRFTTTVPLTSRPQRPNETNGVEYIFTTRPKLTEMISRGEMMEFGEFKGNVYGTSYESVLAASSKGTPLLTPSEPALRGLRTARFAPFLIFIRPPPRREFMKSREAHRSSTRPHVWTEGVVDEVMTTSAALARDYGGWFDGEIVNGDLDIAVAELGRMIDAMEAAPSWVPLSWASKEDDEGPARKPSN